MHVLFFLRNCIDKRRSLHSGEMQAVILLVSITIPKKVTQGDRHSILEVLTRALMFSYNRSIACRLFKHLVELGAPALRSYLNSGVGGRHHGYVGGTNEWHQLIE